MTLIRDHVIDEERKYRLDQAARQTIVEEDAIELGILIKADPKLGELIRHFYLCSVEELEKDGAPISTVACSSETFLSTMLALISMFRRELTLRNLETTYGK